MNKLLKLTFLFLIAISLSQVRAQEISFNDLTFEDLNGLSLNEVFRDNNNYDYLGGGFYATFDYTHEKYVLATPDGVHTEVVIYINILNDLIYNHNYYVNAYIEKNGFIGHSMQVYDPSGYVATIDSSVYESYYSFNFVYSHNNIDTYIRWREGVTGINDILYYKNIYIIDLTSLGIDLSVEQMDYYYSLYKQHEGGYALDTNAFSFNVFERFTEFFYIMLEYAQLGMDFLFTTQTIGFDGIVIFGERYFTFNLKFIPFYSITTLAISMTLIYLGKKYIPFL